MRMLKSVIGAMLLMAVVFQCVQVMNSGPKSSWLRIPFASNNVSQIQDSSFVAHSGGSNSDSETSLRDETYLTTVSSSQNEGKGFPLINGTSEVNGTSKIAMEPVPEPSFPSNPVEEFIGIPPAHSPLDEKTATENGKGRLAPPPLSPRIVEKVSGTPPAYKPSDGKITTENENGRFASPSLPPSAPPASENKNGKVASLSMPPVNAPLVAPPSENTKKNDSSEDPTREEETNRLPKVVSISQMNEMLQKSRHSYRAMKPLWPSALDEEILSAKSQIENAVAVDDPKLYGPLFRNVSMFRRSYELMEQILKVYVYQEGKSPVFHRPPLKGIYASEGWFMKHLEASKKFVTKDPAKAHLFYIPFSSRQLEETLYVKDSHSMDNLVAFLNDYLITIMGRYSYWNRTGGADHFVVACHDWASYETGKVMPNSIRALCNADIKEGFIFGKDVSLVETNVRNPKKVLADIGGKPPSQRDTLAFFAGKMHGYLRPVLLEHWGNKDPDMKIFGKLPRSKKGKNYNQYMKSSKYCICPRGYEVNSPRVVEAIFFECVPVIISDNFVPPFFEIFNWKSFAVFVAEKDVTNLKTILLSISEKQYIEMQTRVKKVQQHFLWHAKPEKYDLFHMILHSIWFNRVFTFQP